MVEFLLASNLTCSQINEVVARAAVNPYLEDFVRTEVIEALSAEAPNGCVVIDPRRK
jgi:hypothetical protein